MNWFTRWWRRLGSDGDQQQPRPLPPSWRDQDGDRDAQPVVDDIITAGTGVFFDAGTFSDGGGSSFTGDGGSFGGGGSSGSW